MRVTFSHAMYALTSLLLPPDVRSAHSTTSSERTHASAPEHSRPSHRQLLSRMTTFCYSDEISRLLCDPEPVSSPACGTENATTSTFCALSDDFVFGVDNDRWLATYTFDYCSDRVMYIERGQNLVITRSDCNAEGVTCSSYCKVLESTGNWSTRRRAAVTVNSASKDTPFWRCPWWLWHDGSCRDSTRYLGESCWGGTECYNDGIKPYDGLHMSCAVATGVATTPTCIPSAFDIERNRCECNWFDWNFFFVCGSSQCNGHPCVFNMGDTTRYCDYQEDNNW
jgi:hypothetical protein